MFTVTRVGVLLILCISSTLAISLDTTTTSASKCPDALVQTTRTITHHGHSVEITNFSCPSLKKRAAEAFVSAETENEPRDISSLQARDLARTPKRSASQCTGNPLNCICGQTCTTNCNTLISELVILSDCQTLTLVVGSEQGSFFLGPMGSQSAKFDTCEITAFNPSSSTTIEYCFDDWASAMVGSAEKCAGGSPTLNDLNCIGFETTWELG
ncbi:hypothetical protein SISNIDRAFT_452575 [Sistotremastrum niveocremeum HHB9708]|uniref:Cyanovirin-N domain-containing protein n=1 Tax=Sistotremastrum niveocremeum HHB9708 TaxID=1314777 RepID=A0A164WP35_9AGAM|nr:hypothetical protein SISNIDRAFT_452575 [Sistotremastrum niveocremeum HHB9708]